MHACGSMGELVLMEMYSINYELPVRKQSHQHQKTKLMVKTQYLHDLELHQKFKNTSDEIKRLQE